MSSEFLLQPQDPENILSSDQMGRLWGKCAKCVDMNPKQFKKAQQAAWLAFKTARHGFAARRVWCVRGWRAACVYCDRGLAAPKHPHAGTIRWPWCGRDFAPGPLWQDLAQALVAGCCHWHCAFMVFVFVALCVSGYASEMLSARVAISGHPAPLEHLLGGRQHRVGGATRGHPYISLLRAEARNCPINRVHHSHVPAGLMAPRMSHSG